MGTLTAANYKFVASNTGAVGVYKAQLTAIANNQTMKTGAAVPALTYSLSGFLNGDTASAVSGLPILTTTATSASIPGTYPITLKNGTLASANYYFTPVSGWLTVTK